MPSFEHEFPINLFRKNPRLVVELLRAATGMEAAYDRLDVGDSNLSQVVPTEFRADLVILLSDRERRVLAGIIIEVQRHIDPHKLLSWPAYVANLRSERECPVTLLVLALDARVAEWARQSIPLGHPDFELTPVVLGQDDVPRVEDLATASERPALSMLSVLAHADRVLIDVASEAIKQLPNEEQKLYSRVLEDRLRKLVPQHPGGSRGVS